jgi:3-hydroxyisobutyrate dehydrogenase-like beta-hydroxyacid dehydrogenase
MCDNLLKAGHRLSVFDIAPSHVERAVGNVARDSARSVAEDSTVVITMLPDGNGHSRQEFSKRVM